MTVRYTAPVIALLVSALALGARAPASGQSTVRTEVDTTLETGGLYETGGRAWVVKPDRDRMAAVYHRGEWAALRVRAVGGDIDVWVNDHLTASLRDDPGRVEGHLGLQLHGGQDMHVEYRGLELMDLSGPQR